MLSVEDDNDDVDDPAAADNECDNCVTISIANTPSPLTISILEGVFSTHCIIISSGTVVCWVLGYFGGSLTSHNSLYYNIFIYCALQAMLLP